PGWRIFLPSTAAWSDGDRKTKVVRYLDVTESPEAWSISARIQYPTINGAPRWTDGTAFGLVAYRDGHNAVFFNFQSNRHLIESLTGNVRRLEREATATQLAGWLRIAYTAGRMEFYYRASTEAQWSLVESIDDLPFVPTRIGINARNFFNLIGTATFSDIEIDGAAIDPAKLADDTDDPRPTWLHNQVIRVTDDDGDGIAESVATVFDMPDDVSHESHQIQDIEIAADGTLIVSVGDGFDFTKARDTSTFLGKILRLARDGSAPSDNPFYDPEQPAAPISYIYNAGVRNTFGLALRRSDKRLFASENGPSRDRIFAPEAGWDMGYDGSDRSMLTHALLTWAPAVVPVGIEVMQSGAFPQHDDWIFVATAGQDFTLGTSKTGKRILMLRVDAEGKLVEGPIELLRYEGSARTTVIGLAAAPDGLYFTTLYNTDPTADAFNNARLLRIRPSAVAPSL
ncbi:MAG TPA: PQQ-dependent sugar dehydrogenase, partial [Terriglobales bacterium]|nr:PQQ-dependent sugar dehydrogenase [Terriglobales bacterium]